MAKLVEDDVLRATWEAVQIAGSIRGAAKYLGIARTTVRNHLKLAEEYLDLVSAAELHGEVAARKAIKRPLPDKGKIKRYLVTSAQNNTTVNEEFWHNLLAFADHNDAEILVSLYSYNKNAYGPKSVKPGTYGPNNDDVEDLWFDDRIEQFISNDRVELAPHLVFCGEANILPTAIRPLSGFETYTGIKSGIFPHAKMAMESIPAMRGGKNGAKHLYTTGTVTRRNYIQKKAGMKAEFHHTYGALLVEVNDKGHWWVRQINADKTGSFYDLNEFVSDGEVSVHEGIEAITWGDIHMHCLDKDVKKLNWGEGGILDTLQPKYQFMHDLIDFRARNHHDRGDPHKTFLKYTEEDDNVEGEFYEAAAFLKTTANRDWCETIVVDSNHDNAFEKWLREGDYKSDPENAIFFLTSQLAKYEAIEGRNRSFHSIENAMRNKGVEERHALFLRSDQSFTTCNDTIENGMHGHLGPSGSRGSPRNLCRIGMKANTAHTHAAQIIDGLYVSGTSAALVQDWTHGPSSWSWSHTLTYPNGKRCILTIWDFQWRA